MQGLQPGKIVRKKESPEKTRVALVQDGNFSHIGQADYLRLRLWAAANSASSAPPADMAMVEGSGIVVASNRR